MREIPQYKIESIENNHGRITKSIYVISGWLMETKRFESLSRKLGNKGTLKYIWSHRNKAINEMLKTGLFEIRIHKPGDNRGLWLYVLHIEREGVEINLCAPYPLYRNIIGVHHSKLEITGCNKDIILCDNVECNYRKKRFKLDFIIQNIDKSKLKLIDKMKGN